MNWRSDAGTAAGTAFITGVTGQDGSYLAESLLSQGWEVHGLVRHVPVHPQINEGETKVEGVEYHLGDLSRPDDVGSVLKSVKPDVVFNLGGISSVYQSWQQPYETALVSGAAVVSMLEVVWQLQQASNKEIRFLQASSAELFGEAQSAPQNEMTPIRPVSPYGAAKAFAHHAVNVYRSRGLFAASAILYNHESLRRPARFVTRKITAGAAAIAAGKLDKLSLGNLNAVRDWGWAPDFVDAMERIAGAASPQDFVVATGVSHSVQDFVEAAFRAVGIDDWQSVVATDTSLERPSDAAAMRGDITRISSELGWRPSMDFQSLVGAMVRNDQDLLSRGIAPPL